jgi:flagellar basal body-associated protein FliL
MKSGRNLAMKSDEKEPSLVLRVIYPILWILLFFTGLLLLGGTLYAMVFLREGNAVANRPPPEPQPPAGGEQLFTGIGRIRVSTGDGSATIIVSITFPYSPADKPFSEELAARVGNFRTIATDYFKSFSAAEFGSMDETILKEELLSRYNSILRLGRIRTLYFNDFLYLSQNFADFQSDVSMMFSPASPFLRYSPSLLS